MYGYPSDRRIQLSENKRTQEKAKIKRASAAARREATMLANRDIKQLKRVYQQASTDIKARILAHQNVDGVLTIDVLQSLLSDVNQRIATLATERDGVLVAGMNANAQVGIKPFLHSASINANLATVAHDAVQFVQTFVAEDGLQLSDRLWRINRQARELVGEAIESSIIQGYSASRAAEEFLQRGQIIPPELLKKMRSASANALGRIPGKVLMTDKMSSYAQAERVFRTEINRAHIETYRNSAFEHPDVVGTKFLLSSRHPKADICDLHASANIYGLGSGIYPKGKSPLPAHPNTLSYEVVVFDDEVTAADKAGKESRIDWLNNQKTATKVGVLGVNKTWALEKGLLKNNQINTPWHVLKRRYEKLGLNIPQKSVAVPITDLPTSVSPGKAVSEAFKVLGHKTIAKHVFGVIDSLHDDGVLPVIPIKSNAARRVYGSYRRTLHDNRAIEIKVSRYGDHKEHTMIHEIGHFIDHQGLPDAGMSSEFSTKLDSWRRAVLNTAEVRQLEKSFHGPYSAKGKKYFSYLLRKREMWARSYAQWISIRSGDKTLMRQLNSIRDNDHTDYPTQWSDKSFAPVAEEIDKLFEALGWIKTQI